MRRLAPLLAVPLLAAGCFGGGATHYTAAKSTPCLKKDHKVFTLATGKGAAKLGIESLMGLDSPGHIVAFYKTDKQAEKGQVIFNRQLAKVGAGGNDTVETQHNVMLVLPSDDRTEDQSILDCLK